MSQVSVYNLSGGNGSKYISSTAATGDFFAIQFLSDTTITSITGNMEGTPTETFSKGDVIYGRFSAITISGTALLYKNS